MQARGLLQGRRRLPRRARASTRPASAPAANGGSRSSACAGTILDAFAAAAQRGRHPATRRLQPRRQRRRRLLRGQPARRHALERDQGVPAAGAAPRRTCRSGPARTSTRVARSTTAAATGVEVAPLGGGAPVTARLAPGGEVDPRRRRDRHAADPAALGHRRRRRCCSSTASRSRHDAARRRREPAGPPADPRRLRRRGREDAEHAGGDAAGARR